eukprot:scaffold11300_cov32-Tisochrysis_lutea.AAC.7
MEVEELTITRRDVDHTAPTAAKHAGENCMRQSARRHYIDVDSSPGTLTRPPWIAYASIVDQHIDLFLLAVLAKTVRAARACGVEYRIVGLRTAPVGAHLPCFLGARVAVPAGEEDPRSLQRELLSEREANPAVGASDERGGAIKYHRCASRSVRRGERKLEVASESREKEERETEGRGGK